MLYPPKNPLKRIRNLRIANSLLGIFIILYIIITFYFKKINMLGKYCSTKKRNRPDKDRVGMNVELLAVISRLCKYYFAFTPLIEVWIVGIYGNGSAGSHRAFHSVKLAVNDVIGDVLFPAVGIRVAESGNAEEPEIFADLQAF